MVNFRTQRNARPLARTGAETGARPLVVDDDDVAYLT